MKYTTMASHTCNGCIQILRGQHKHIFSLQLL